MSSLSTLMLPPLSGVYSAVTRTRLAAYQRGLLPITKLDAPVISVGNLTTGGTGKTPLVEWLCRALAREDRRICILTRGYGRANPRTRVLVSDGTKVLSNPGLAGDEPFLLAQNLTGIAAVISDPDRVAAGQWAIQKLGSQVFVLDDGFQYLRLARDLNILTIDATNPWGGGYLLPYGRMREPRSGVSRADCVVFTRSEQGEGLSSINTEVRKFLGTRPILVSRMKTRGIRELPSPSSEWASERAPEPSAILDQPAAAFGAIGNPKSFFDHLRREGHKLVLTRAFADHHNYNQSDVDCLIKVSQRLGAQRLITTSKDAVKLQTLSFAVPCHILDIEISFADKAQLLELINKAVSIQASFSPT